MTNIIRTQAAAALSALQGMTRDDALHVLDALRLDGDDLAYVAEYPEHVSRLKPTSSADGNRLCGAAGWVVWFEPSFTARAVRNADPSHVEHVASLAEAVAAS